MKKNRSFLQKLRPVTLGSAMADLALLLLIFFMAATTSEPPKGEEVDLPFAESQAEHQGLYITIGRTGKIYFDGVLISLDDLRNKLILQHYDKDKNVIITADSSLEYKTVAQVLTILQEEKFLNAVFMSQPRKEEDLDVQ